MAERGMLRVNHLTTSPIMDVTTISEFGGVGLKNYHFLNGAIICHTGVTLK